MTIKSLALSLLTGLLLSGCNQQAAVELCSSPDTQKVIRSQLMEQAEKLTAEKKYDYYDGSFVISGSQIRATLAQVQVVVDDVKGIKQDGNSGKSVCSGSVKITVPTALLTQIDQARDIQHQAKIAQYAEQLHIGQSNNVFSQAMEYSVQTMPPSREQQVELGGTPLVTLLDEMTTSALLRTMLGEQDVQQIQPAQEERKIKQDVGSSKVEVEPAQPEAEKISIAEQKQGLARLNQELLEADQAQRELDQERAAQPLVPRNADIQH